MSSQNERESGIENLVARPQGKAAFLREALEKNYVQAQEDFEAARQTGDPEVAEIGQMKLEAAEKRRELFSRERDQTGCWKRDRLGRDMARDMRDRSWERDEEDQLSITEEDKRTHLLLINMGELDRLNSSGDHALGDAGLSLTAEEVEHVVRDVLGRDPVFRDERRLAEAYDLYRHSGNDFAVNLRAVEEDAAQEIQMRLAGQRVDISRAKSGEEPVPLSVSRVTRADGLALLNGLDKTPAEAGVQDQTAVINAMLEMAQTLNDVSKVEIRSRRVVEKILTARSSEDEKAAEDFYEKFMKKSLGAAFRTEGGADILGFQAFKRLAEQKRAFPFPSAAEWSHFVTEKSLESAFQQLKARRSQGRELDLAIARKVAKDVMGRREDFGTASSSQPAETKTADWIPPEETNGKKEIYQQTALAAESQNRAREGEKAALRAELDQIALETEKAKRDERTGLFNRGMYFETLESVLKSGRPISTVMIDMAFLKYFDNEGGPQAGNVAIEKAAEILDRAAQALTDEKLKVQAYRVGGDEFALTLVGGDDATAREAMRLIEQSARKAGRLPGQPGASRPGYKPESLQFNFGVRTARDASSFASELEDAGIRLSKKGTKKEVDELAEYLTRLADKEVEIHKGLNRLMLLTVRTLEAENGDSRGNLEALTAYSQKAIFGETGKAKVAEFAARLKNTSDRPAELRRIDAEALEFVIQQIDKKHEGAGNYENSLDKRLEDAVRIRYFEDRIRHLEEEMSVLRLQLDRERGQNEQLRNQMAAAEYEMRSIVQLRQRIGTSAVSPQPGTNMSAAA